MFSDPTTPTDDIVALKAARALDERALRTLFLEARSANGFLPRPVPHSLIERIFELAELGPTSSNTLPLRRQQGSPAQSALRLRRSRALPLASERYPFSDSGRTG